MDRPAPDFPEGSVLPKLTNDVATFLDRVTLVCGTRMTGKTSTVLHILRTISPEVDDVCVYTDSAPQRQAYLDHGIASDRIRRLGHPWEEKAKLTLLEACAPPAATAATAALPAEKLAALYQRCRTPEGDCLLSSIAQIRAMQGLDASAVDELEARVLQKLVAAQAASLPVADLTESERMAVRGYSSRRAIVIDGPSVYYMNKSDAFHRVFTHGRDLGITFILTCQNPNHLDPFVREHAHVYTMTSCITVTEAIMNLPLSPERCQQLATQAAVTWPQSDLLHISTPHDTIVIDRKADPPSVTRMLVYKPISTPPCTVEAAAVAVTEDIGAVVVD